MTAQLSAYLKKTGGPSITVLPPPCCVVFYCPLFSFREIKVEARESVAQKSLENVFGQSMLEAALI